MPSAPDYTTGCTVENGKLLVRNLPAFERALRRYEGMELDLTLAVHHATRSLRANRYYFGVVLRRIAEHTGHAVEDLHDDMKARFLSKPIVYVNPATGEITERRITASTSTLTTVQFYEFVEQVRLFAAEFLGITIEDPDHDYLQEVQAAREAA